MGDLILVLSSMFISCLLLRFFSCSYCLSCLYRLLLFFIVWWGWGFRRLGTLGLVYIWGLHGGLVFVECLFILMKSLGLEEACQGIWGIEKGILYGDPFLIILFFS